MSANNIIFIHGVPRSGTSWLGQIFNSSPFVSYRFQPLFSYAFKGALNANSSLEEINSFLNKLSNTEDPFILQKTNASGNSETNFKKESLPTHLVIKEVRYHYIIENLLIKLPHVKIIGIVRNPCACINSWLNTPKEFYPEWDKHAEWRNGQSKNNGRPEEYFGFEKWKEMATKFLYFSRKYPENFKLVHYEALNANTYETVNELFKFCKLSSSQQTIDFIDHSKKIEGLGPYSVLRKSKNIDTWQTELDPTIMDAIVKDIENTELSQFLI